MADVDAGRQIRESIAFTVVCLGDHEVAHEADLLAGERFFRVGEKALATSRLWGVGRAGRDPERPLGFARCGGTEVFGTGLGGRRCGWRRRFVRNGRRGDLVLGNDGWRGICGAAKVRRRRLMTAARGNDEQSAVRNAKPSRRPTKRHAGQDSASEGGGIAKFVSGCLSYVVGPICGRGKKKPRGQTTRLLGFHLWSTVTRRLCWVRYWSGRDWSRRRKTRLAWACSEETTPGRDWRFPHTH